MRITEKMLFLNQRSHNESWPLEFASQNHRMGIVWMTLEDRIIREEIKKKTSQAVKLINV